MSDRLCIPCSNGRCERCDGETQDGACGCHCGGHKRPAAPTRDAEQAVREALDHLAKWPQSMNRDEFLVDVEVLLTAVRQAERARIRGIVEGWTSANVRRVDVLAALDGPE